MAERIQMRDFGAGLLEQSPKDEEDRTHANEHRENNPSVQWRSKGLENQRFLLDTPAQVLF
jgi:hypothetical protein